MKTGFKEHLITGLFALAFLILLIMILAPKPFALMLAASFAFLLGSILPDIDAPFSIVRRAMTALLFILLLFAALAFMFIFFIPLSLLCVVFAGLGAASCAGVLLLLALAVPVLSIVLLNMIIPGHRGVLHGFLAAFLYGAFLSIIAFAFRLPISDNLFIACAGMLGYVVHIFTDLLGSILR